MVEIALIVIVLIVFVGIVSMLDRRVKTKGSLFTGTPSLAMRIVALLLAVVFTGFSVVQLLSTESIQCLFPILAFASFAYALGATTLLRRLQGDKTPDHEEESE